MPRHPIPSKQAPKTASSSIPAACAGEAEGMGSFCSVQHFCKQVVGTFLISLSPAPVIEEPGASSFQPRVGFLIGALAQCDGSAARGDAGNRHWPLGG